MSPWRPGQTELVPQLIRFLLVGVVNTAIQYVVFVLLYEVMGINYLLASIAGYCLGVLNSYLLNRRWTFASGNARILPEAVRFTTVNLLALGANTGLLFVLVSTQSMRPLIAQLWAITASVSMNFILNKTWTFRRRPEASRASADGRY